MLHRYSVRHLTLHARLQRLGDRYRRLVFEFVRPLLGSLSQRSRSLPPTSGAPPATRSTSGSQASDRTGSEGGGAMVSSASGSGRHRAGGQGASTRDEEDEGVDAAIMSEEAKAGLSVLTCIPGDLPDPATAGDGGAWVPPEPIRPDAVLAFLKSGGDAKGWLSSSGGGTTGGGSGGAGSAASGGGPGGTSSSMGATEHGSVKLSASLLGTTPVGVGGSSLGSGAGQAAASLAAMAGASAMARPLTWHPPPFCVEYLEFLVLHSQRRCFVWLLLLVKLTPRVGCFCARADQQKARVRHSRASQRACAHVSKGELSGLLRLRAVAQTIACASCGLGTDSEAIAGSCKASTRAEAAGSAGQSAKANRWRDCIRRPWRWCSCTGFSCSQQRY